MNHMLRNLIYFICPFASNDEWRKNVIALKKYWAIFNGKKIISISVGHGLCEASEVESYVGFNDVEFIHVDNCEKLGEVVAFVPVLERVYSLNDTEISFYAHAKGVTPGKSVEELEAEEIWRNLMYVYCLSDSIKIDAILSHYACAGTFAKYGTHHLPMPVKWHFSGTFFWFNHKQLFSKNWRKIENNRYGVEGYLPLFFEEKNMFCLFGDNPNHSNLYRYKLNDWLQFYNFEKNYAQESGEEYSLEYTSYIVKKIEKCRDYDELDLFMRKEGLTLDDINKWEHTIDDINGVWKKYCKKKN
ncbi:hypothetical protein LCGC14_2500670 [marine sediment metagenome]|uniref:Uncharacterized protein n=1 Tax=marine sediment metagenome TaxID=412755 RepID=A0A0F9B2P6_9ZZZZ